MQATEDWRSGDSASGPSRPRYRRLAIQALVSPTSVVVLDVLSEHCSEPRLGQHDHVVQAFSADAANDTLDVSVLPRRLRRSLESADPQARDGCVEQYAVGSIPVSEKETRAVGVFGERRPDLPSKPQSRGIRRHAEVQDRSAIMGKDHENEQPPKGQGRDREHVASSDLMRVVPQEGVPPLASAAWASADHVLGHGGFRDFVAQEPQFELDARCAPQVVLLRQAPNEEDDVQRRPRIELRRHPVLRGSDASGAFPGSTTMASIRRYLAWPLSSIPKLA